MTRALQSDFAAGPVSVSLSISSSSKYSNRSVLLLNGITVGSSKTDVFFSCCSLSSVAQHGRSTCYVELITTVKCA